MTFRIIECEQHTEEWQVARMGMPTASCFDLVQAKGKNGEPSKTRRTYLLKLAGERITQKPMESYSNEHIERGRIMEAEAREFYSLGCEDEIKLIGFITDDAKGCSPDALVGKSGILEIKTSLPHILIDLMLKDTFPAEHVAQCQGNLWIAEREWIDIAVYWPGLPMFKKRAYRDISYIAKLNDAVRAFNEELADVEHKIKLYGGIE